MGGTWSTIEVTGTRALGLESDFIRSREAAVEALAIVIKEKNFDYVGRSSRIWERRGP